MKSIIKIGFVFSLFLFLGTVAFGQSEENKTLIAKPIYPAKAKKAGIKGTVKVRITVDENGKVIKALAFRGPQQLRKAAEQAALKSTFSVRIFEEQEKGIKTVINFTFDENTPTR